MRCLVRGSNPGGANVVGSVGEVQSFYRAGTPNAERKGLGHCEFLRQRIPMQRFLIPAVLLVVSLRALALETPPRVEVRRLPAGGIKPVVAVDERGMLHATYFTGDPKAGDAHYVTSKDGGATWSQPLRVNSQPGSVMGMSRARGPRMAPGRGGRLHVLWLGSAKAEPAGNPNPPRAPGGPQYPSLPLLYARLDEGGKKFESQRKILRHATGLDGDCSIAVDSAGRVYAVAHAKEPGDEGEAKRSVYVVRSEDDGKTFAEEKNVLPEPTGACACCALTARVDGAGRLVVLYRQAWQTFDRGMNMLASSDGGKSFRLSKLDQWHLAACPMSVSALLPTGGGLLAAWENDGQIFWGAPGGSVQPLVGKAGTRKAPALATNARGETLIAWIENASFSGGGTVVWQVYRADGKPTDVMGRRPDLPPHDWVAVAVRPDGGFVLLY